LTTARRAASRGHFWAIQLPRRSSADLAEGAGFELLLTTDKNIRYQPNLTARKIGNSQWRVVRQYSDKILAAVNAATPGSYVEVQIPYE
jgi:hypothetical protein